MAMQHGKSVGIHFIQDRDHPTVSEAVVEVELDGGNVHQFFTIQVLQVSQRFTPEAVPQQFKAEVYKDKKKEEAVKGELAKDKVVENKVKDNASEKR